MSTRLDDALTFHANALGLRARRQEILAANIANAETPNFKARDVNFRAELEAAMGGNRAGAPALLRTSARHFSGTEGAGAAAAMERSLLYRVPLQASIDGNTVEMDQERAQFAENALHYEANLAFLNLQIKNMLSVIQG